MTNLFFKTKLIPAFLASALLLAACSNEIVIPTPIASLPTPEVPTETPTTTANVDTGGTPVEENTPMPQVASLEQAGVQKLLADSLGLTEVQPGSIGIEGTYAFSVTAPSSIAPSASEPLWVAHTIGIRNFDPLQNHVVAIYQKDGLSWQEIARIELIDPLAATQDTDAQAGEAISETATTQASDSAVSTTLLSPDYLGQGSVMQVNVEPSHLWIEVSGGVGAHSGIYTLFSFDGKSFTSQASNSSSSPGGGSVRDLTGDGLAEVILDRTDYYVFCYACGAWLIQYDLMRWDGEKMVPVRYEELPVDAPAELKTINDTAVAAAKAGLWKDALAAVEEAESKQLTGDQTEDQRVFANNAALIRVTGEARRAQAEAVESPYPLLDKTFYGDFAGAVDQLRGYTPESIFNPQAPFIVGSMAEGNESSLATQLVNSTAGAIQLQPTAAESAPAYFLHALGSYLNNDIATAQSDLQQAASLASDDGLLKDSQNFMKTQ